MTSFHTISKMNTIDQIAAIEELAADNYHRLGRTLRECNLTNPEDYPNLGTWRRDMVDYIWYGVTARDITKATGVPTRTINNIGSYPVSMVYIRAVGEYLGQDREVELFHRSQVGYRLWSARVLRGLTIQDVADMCHLGKSGRQWVSKMEKGYWADRDRVNHIARTLGADLTKL